MFCQKCGKELSKDMIFCDKCGAKNNYAINIDKTVSTDNATKPNFTNVNETPTPKNHENKPGCFVNLIKCLVILAIIASIFHSCTGGDKKTTKNTDTTTQTANKEKAYKIGDPLTADKLEVTINSVEEKSGVGGEFSKKTPAQGGVYIAIQYQFKNISDEPISSFSQPKINLIDKNGTTYNSDLGASVAYAREANSDTKIISNLNPGITVKDYKVYEISKDLFEKGGWKVLISYKDQSFKVDINSSTKTNNTKTTTTSTQKNTKVADTTASTNQSSTENKKSGNKDEVKQYVIHNIFEDDISKVSSLSIGNPITVNNTTYYGIIYAANNESKSVKLLCLDYTNKKTLSYDEMDAILAPLGKSHSDLQN